MTRNGDKFEANGHDGHTALKALQLIKSVGEVEPFQISPIVQHQGSIRAATDVMAAKVRWADKAGYTVLTRTLPESFAPFNAIIRVSEIGTEDEDRDYLAQFVEG
jgi:hypothetical protein